jgi:hypothetical protein
VYKPASIKSSCQRCTLQPARYERA